MTTAFISDLHLTPKNPQSLSRFAAFMSEAGRRLQALYILGDLFDYWVGDDGGESLGLTEAEAAMRAAAEAGCAVHYLRGNRDFLVGDDFAARTGCTLLPDPSRITLHGRRFVLTHGDALCTADEVHQAARREMVSQKWTMAFLRQPLEERIAAAKAMREKSAADKRGRAPATMDVVQADVEALLRKHDARVLIHGHTHRAGVHAFTLDGATAWRYVLGDGPAGSSVLYCREGEVALKRGGF